MGAMLMNCELTEVTTMNSMKGMKLRGLGLAAISFLVIGSANLLAQPTNLLVRPISLQECLALALTNNLDLRIERLNPLVKLQTIEIDRSAYDPLFSLSGSHSYSKSGGGLNRENLVLPSTKTEVDTFGGGLSGATPWSGLTYNLSGSVSERYGTGATPFDNSGGSAGLSVTQPLLRGLLMDGARYQILYDKNNYKVSEQQLRQQMITVLTTVEQAYYDLIFARENVKVQQKGLELAQRLLAENKRRVEIGKLAPLDEKQSESQVAARQTDLITAQRSYGTSQNNLKKVITGNYLTLHDVILEPTDALLALPFAVDLQESWRKGMAMRPDLVQARLDLEREGITLKYYKNQLLPQLDLTGSYGYGASGVIREFSDAFADLARADKPSYSVGAIFSIPLENKAARSRYRQEKINVDQALLKLKKSEETALVEIDESAGSLTAAYTTVQSSREARIYAEAALDAEQKKLEAGKSTSFVVLQLQRDLTAARSEEIKALSDYNKAQADLAQKEGATLERARLNVRPQ
jgi:outer membrane protein